MRDVRLFAWERWRAAAGPWRGWAICPPLMIPNSDQVCRSPHRTRAANLADSLRDTLEGGRYAVLVDLEPILGVQLAAHLNELRLAHPVLVLPRWPYSDALLPTEQLVAMLVDESHRLVADTTCGNVAFVLDAERSRSVRHRRQGDRRVDNRYAVSAADLPTLAGLRRAGITRVLKIAHR